MTIENKIYYSKSTQGFYRSEFHGDNMPEDKVEITPEMHTHLLKGESEGKIIDVSMKGKPILKDHVESDTEKKDKSNKTFKKQIMELERDLQPRALRDALLSNDLTRLQAIETQIASLRAQLK